MEHEDWPAQLTKTVGKRVAYYRQRRTDKRGHKLTAQGLAELCTELGLPTGRPAIAKLESGIRQSITMAEVLVLAKALEVAPVHLLIPVGYAAEFEVLPGMYVEPGTAYEWFIGNSEDPADPTAPPQFGADSPLGLWAEHLLRVGRIRDSWDYLVASRAGETWNDPMVGPRPPDVENAAYDLGLEVARLHRVRDAMAEAGMTPPRLGPEVDQLVSQDMGPSYRRGQEDSGWSTGGALPPGHPYGPNRGER